MQYCVIGVLGLALSVSAEAPRWVFPTPRSPGINRQLRGPCGVDDNGDFSDNVHTTNLNPGPLTVTWQEPVNNAGSTFRIALSRENLDSYEECILLDNIPHNDDSQPDLNNPGSWTRYSVTVDIPDINCDKCALQLVNIVVPGGQTECQYHASDTMDTSNERCYQSYHSCANIKISGGNAARNSYTCAAPTDGGWPFAGDDGVYAYMSNPHWKNGVLMDPAVPNHFRSVFADGATILPWGTAVAVVADQDDDAMENLLTNSVMLRDRYLTLSSSRVVGIRFQDIDLPPNAEIVDARLKLHLDTNATNSDVDFTISFEASADSQSFRNMDIWNRQMEESFATAKITSGQMVFESDPMNIPVQELLENRDWQSGNAISLILDVVGDTGSSVKIGTFESGKPAQLHIRYTVERYIDRDGSDRPTPAPSPVPDQPCTYAVRDRIMGNYLERGFWYHGRVDELIESVNGDPTQCLYTIVYDDGDREEEVVEANLRPETEPARTQYQVRERVDVRMENGVFERGTVQITQANGKYTVELDDGRVLVDVDQSDLRQWVEYFVNDQVEIEQCFWFEAVIQDVLPDGRYECEMTDGGYMAHVTFESMREQLSEDQQFTSGEIIQVFIDGVWKQGFVIQENGDNTYMIGVSGEPVVELSWPPELMAKCEEC